MTGKCVGQNRLFEQRATEREKRRDWVAEKIGFELVVAFRWTFAIYWPTKCVFRLSAANRECQTGESGRLHGFGIVSANQSLVLFLSRLRIASLGGLLGRYR
jgi:hypothetical protein